MKARPEHFYLLLVMLMICSSCTTIHYQSTQSIPTYFSAKNTHNIMVTLEGKKDFFLWGFIPSTHEVDIDQLAQERGHKEISKIVVEEYVSPLNIILTGITFGLYSPRNFRIQGLGLKASGE